MTSKVLVALDSSRRAPDVFDCAVEIAFGFRAILYPFRAILIPPEFPPAAASSHADPLPDHLAKLALDDLLHLALRAKHANVRLGVPIVRFGRPSQLIIQVSDELDVDLIVLGSHGYHGLDRLLGTTAAHVANLAQRSVLVVHERVDSPLQ